RPARATSQLIDEGRWLYSAIVAFAVAALVNFTLAERIYPVYEAAPTPLSQIISEREFESEEEENIDPRAYLPPEMLVTKKPLPVVGNAGWYFVSFSQSSTLASPLTLALFYLPVAILAMVLITQTASFGVAIRRDYGPLLVCALMAWAASHLPFALAGLLLDRYGLGANSALILWAAAKLVFGFYMIIALRAIYGARLIESAGAVSVSWLSAPVEMIFAASRLLWLLASPCIFYLIYSSIRSGLGDVDSAFRSRQSFRRSLEAATINPRDAEAHYQLGLIYQYRRQYSEAINRFKKAIEIDPSETDAHFQLGRIAREQGRLQDAIEHFNTTVAQDDNHSHSEIWREIGATYADAGMFEDARSALDTYIERRPYDPEGLYLMAQTLNRLDQKVEAREMLERCLESVRTMPFYRRGAVRKWGRLAQKQLREIGAESA
ncbi:MAG: tetratricopeptide repeat protein, partial [Acidobacteriota bacterium]